MVFLQKNSIIVDTFSLETTVEEWCCKTFITGGNSCNVLHILAHHRVTWAWERSAKYCHLFLSFALQEPWSGTKELVFLFFISVYVLWSHEIKKLVKINCRLTYIYKAINSSSLIMNIARESPLNIFSPCHVVLNSFNWEFRIVSIYVQQVLFSHWFYQFLVDPLIYLLQVTIVWVIISCLYFNWEETIRVGRVQCSLKIIQCLQKLGAHMRE